MIEQTMSSCCLFDGQHRIAVLLQVTCWMQCMLLPFVLWELLSACLNWLHQPAKMTVMLH
jgi:hypothetical protein